MVRSLRRGAPGTNGRNRQSDWRKRSPCSGVLGLPDRAAVFPRRDAGPVLEGAMEGAGFRETHAVGDLDQRQPRLREVLDRGVAPQLVLDLLETAALFTQAAAQRLRRHGQG